MSDPFDAHYQVLRSDAEARRRLIEHPKAELARFFGAPFPDGSCEVEIIEERRDTIAVLLPAPPESSGDVTTRLDRVAGSVLDLLFTSGIGGFLIPREQLTWTLRDMRSTWAGSSAGGQPDSDKRISSGT